MTISKVQKKGYAKKMMEKLKHAQKHGLDICKSEKKKREKEKIAHIQKEEERRVIQKISS
jgi:hypothetical protein